MKLISCAGVVIAGALLFAFIWHKISFVCHNPHALSTQIDVAQYAQAPLIVHLACIQDGNRRWAKQRGLEPVEGHKAGIDASKRIIEFCLEKKIKYLSLYTLSTENFNRTQQELKGIFDLMLNEAHKGVQEFKKNGIRVRFLGDRSLFPPELIPYIDQFEKETAHCDALHVSFLFCYGGQQEIVAAAKNIARKIKSGELTEDDITPELFEQNLWTYELPKPDLIIRTGYVSRLSNFLLYQAAYAELFMLDCFWPDMSKEKLQQVYDQFSKSQRRFGK